MTNAELIAELRGHILSVPLTLLHAAADALEAADKRIAELEKQLPKEGEWKWNSLLNEYEWVDTTIYCPNCGAKMRGEHDEQ